MKSSGFKPNPKMSGKGDMGGDGRKHQRIEKANYAKGGKVKATTQSQMDKQKNAAQSAAKNAYNKLLAQAKKVKGQTSSAPQIGKGRLLGKVTNKLPKFGGKSQGEVTNKLIKFSGKTPIGKTTKELPKFGGKAQGKVTNKLPSKASQALGLATNKLSKFGGKSQGKVTNKLPDWYGKGPELAPPDLKKLRYPGGDKVIKTGIRFGGKGLGKITNKPPKFVGLKPAPRELYLGGSKDFDESTGMRRGRPGGVTKIGIGGGGREGGGREGGGREGGGYGGGAVGNEFRKGRIGGGGRPAGKVTNKPPKFGGKSPIGEVTNKPPKFGGKSPKPTPKPVAKKPPPSISYNLRPTTTAERLGASVLGKKLKKGGMAKYADGGAVGNEFRTGRIGGGGMINPIGRAVGNEFRTGRIGGGGSGGRIIAGFKNGIDPSGRGVYDAAPPNLTKYRNPPALGQLPLDGSGGRRNPPALGKLFKKGGMAKRRKGC